MSSPRLASRSAGGPGQLLSWALAAGSAAWWALQWGGARRPDVPVAATAAAAPALDVAGRGARWARSPVSRRRPTPTWPGGWRCRAC
ncbi:MAG: hypothetical protein M9943_08890 [Burkholderiaceae bacterium]|nr:hypothetical protein [Burkholderiaceae bacterium]